MKIILIIALFFSEAALASFSVAGNIDLPDVLDSIPLNYPGNPSSCSELSPNRLDSQQQSNHFGPGLACHMHFYKRVNRGGFQDTIHYRNLDKIINLNISELNSIRGQYCPAAPVWFLVCSESNLKGNCAFSDRKGEFRDLSIHGLKNNVKSISSCSSKEACGKLSDGTIQNGTTDKVYLPCHADLINFSADDLKLSIRKIMRHIQSNNGLYLEVHEKKMVDLVNYWSAIQKRKKIDAALESIPDGEKEVDVEKQRKDKVVNFKSDLNDIVNTLNKSIKEIKETRTSTKNMRNEFKDLVKNSYQNIDQIPNTDFEEKVKSISNAKWDIAEKAQELDNVLSTNIRKISVIKSVLRKIPMQLDAVSNRHNIAENSHDRFEDLKASCDKILGTVLKLEKKHLTLKDNLEREVISHQQKLEDYLKLVIDDVSDAESAKKLQKSRFLQSSSRFLWKVNSKFSLLQESPPSSQFYARPLLLDHYEKYQKLINFSKICMGDVARWMKTGCMNVIRWKPRLDHAIQVKIPGTLTTTIAFLKGLQVELDEVAKIEQLIKLGQWREALSRHDLVLERWRDEG